MTSSKKIILTILSIVLLLAIVTLIYRYGVGDGNSAGTNTETSSQIKAIDGTYKINGQEVTLKNGESSVEAAPGSASKIVTKYFGNELKGDFDGDGTEDTAFLVTQNTGGSGTFYYVTAQLNKATGKVGVDGVLLGDRIAPQSTSLSKNNTIVVSYADRNSGEDFSVAPSAGKSIELKVDNTNFDPAISSSSPQFGEVAQNFEGESNPSIMNLSMKTWMWLNTTYSNDKGVTPKVPGKFTLTLKSDRTFSATTDCNSIGGNYTVSGDKISFSRMISTLMACEGSQESDFSKMLSETQGFLFTSKGELVLELNLDSGSVVFK